MDIGTTPSVSGTSPATPHTELPTSAQQQAAQPPSMYIRLPQSSILAPAPSGMPAVPDSAPQCIDSHSPRSRLCAAACDGDGNTVKRMLAAGNGDLNTIDPATGLTALMLAAQNGHDDVVLILCKGASAIDIHRPNAQGSSALMLAAAAGHADVVELLIGKAATQLHKDQALAAAASSGQVACTQLLLSHGAQPGKRNANGESALSAAEQAGHGTVVQWLKAIPATAAPVTVPASSAQTNGGSGLTHAACEGHLARAQRLLAADADVNETNDGADALPRNPQDKTAARMARQIGHELLAIALDNISTKVDASSSTSATTAGTSTASTTVSSSASASTPVTKAATMPTDSNVRPARWQEAVERNDIEALKQLLTAQQLPDQGTGSGSKPDTLAPLLFAAREGYTAAVEALIEAGAKIDEATSDGWTALMLAAQKGHTAAVRALLEAGAKVDQTDSEDWTALMSAAQNGHTAAVQALLRAGAKVDQVKYGGWTALIFAAWNNHTATVQALLQAGAKVDQAKTDGWTALMTAANRGHTVTVQALLQAGAKVDQAESEGRTALMLAAKHGHTATVQALIQAGANCSLRTISGETALSMASASRHAEIIRLLQAQAVSTEKKGKGVFAKLFG